MALTSGTRLGPYEILSPLGAGGMGEVYRARDSRLSRDVAVKVLPASFSADADRLKRFEHEAQAAGSLNHPNITAVYDIGTHEGAPFVVTELLEGETLRSRLAGGVLSPRRATEFAVQIAHGLAAAHEKGIVHRDLKPENLFVTRDGRVKILDFGLAKLTHPEKPGVALTEIPTQTAGTEPGVVMGTAAYMSPEQVRGQLTDARSDIFSFGAVLYEMLAGERPFRGDTSVETMNAILKEDPADLSQKNRNVFPGLDRVVRHCLEKSLEQRFQSARDLAFDLEALSGVSAPGPALGARGPATRRPGVLLLVAGLALLLAGIAGGYLAGKKAGYVRPASFRQLTFRRGSIASARFAPDGQTIFYAAAWDAAPTEVFVTRLDSPESRPFGLARTEVLAISGSGQMAVSLGRRAGLPYRSTGTLARLSVTGAEAPKEILDEVTWADWAPDGQNLAVAREVGGKSRLEFPVGKVLYETAGWISHPRVSPDGTEVAFLDHPLFSDDAGSAAILDRSGRHRLVSGAFSSVQGLCWSPDGTEVWFTGAVVGFNRSLYAATRSGRVRLLAQGTGGMTIQDVSRDGRVLLVQDKARTGIYALPPGAEKPRDLSWLDWSLVRDISPDGETLLFEEGGEGGGPGYSAYVRKTDGSPAIRLGSGTAMRLSPDGKWALGISEWVVRPRLVLYPIGTGEPRLLDSGGLRIHNAMWLPDGRQILFSANEPDHGARLYIQEINGAKPRAVSPEGYLAFDRCLSPDGKLVAASGPDRRFYLYPVEGGEPTLIPGLVFGDTPVSWSGDGRSLLIGRRVEVPLKVFWLDVRTGRKELWRELMPPDATGITTIGRIVATPDGKSYAYSYIRSLADLYVVEGLK
jgi:eukaryotic-like serine/threonine-protein kinase